MKTYNQIAEIVYTEAKAGSFKTISEARKRLESLCNDNNQKHNLFSLASTLGIA